MNAKDYKKLYNERNIMRNIQLFQPTYRTEEVLNLMRECMNSGWTGQGPRVLEFENTFKQQYGFKTAHMVNSATSGLHLVLEQMKMKYGWTSETEIITSPITFVSTNHAILHAGLKPVFADIDLKTGNIDYVSVRSNISSNTGAIIFVGLGGNIVGLSSIFSTISDEGKIRIIIDAAHMAGTDLSEHIKNQKIEAIVYSFQSVKNLPTADSGLVCWNGLDAVKQDELSRQLTWLGIDKSTHTRTTEGGKYKWDYDVPNVGYKYHANDIDACMALVGLKYLEHDNAYRRQVAEWYDEGLASIINIDIIRHQKGSSRHLYQILVKEGRDYVMQQLNVMGIFPGVHYKTNQRYSMYNSDTIKGICYNAEFWSDNIISLPIGLHVTKQDVQYICETLNKLLK